MVRSNSVESSNTTAVTQTNSGKSTTIAQSLMQMRQCDETSHMGQPLDKSRAPSSPIVRQDTPIQ